jgi:hypothetical protein
VERRLYAGGFLYLDDFVTYLGRTGAVSKTFSELPLLVFGRHFGIWNVDDLRG